MLVLQLLLSVLLRLLGFLEYLLMGYIILSWFVIFGAIKDRDGVFFKVYAFLASKIEPCLAWIRTFIPPIAGFNLSALVVFLAIHFSKILVARLFFLVH
ncbi:MAG: YggT family protein [Holosporales bacterium]|jgi:uncharacterized protein YggT (Ycf19 family)|nr:YggT family protein [Holosporales bacterium]